MLSVPDADILPLISNEMRNAVGHGVDVRQTGGCETPDTARAKKTSLAWPLNPEGNLKDYYQSHTHTKTKQNTQHTF